MTIAIRGHLTQKGEALANSNFADQERRTSCCLRDGNVAHLLLQGDFFLTSRFEPPHEIRVLHFEVDILET